MLDKLCIVVYVLPLMASLIKKKKGNRLYYYLVESARVDGQPRIVHQAYLGTAEKLAELVQRVLDRKSTRLNSSHLGISYAVFCLKKKNKLKKIRPDRLDPETNHNIFVI